MAWVYILNHYQQLPTFLNDNVNAPLTLTLSRKLIKTHLYAAFRKMHVPLGNMKVYWNCEHQPTKTKDDQANVGSRVKKQMKIISDKAFKLCLNKPQACKKFLITKNSSQCYVIACRHSKTLIYSTSLFHWSKLSYLRNSWNSNIKWWQCKAICHIAASQQWGICVIFWKSTILL